MVAPTLREHLATTPFTLSMSCSFFGYFAHCGALRACEEAGLKPRKVTGSSAGAVVAGLYSAGYSVDELEAMFREIGFYDIFTFRPRLYWGFPVVGLFQQNLEALEEKFLSQKPRRLEDCGMPVALSVYDATQREGKVLTSGRIAVAVAASAAVPVFMHGVVDDDGHRLLDAGVGGDMLGVDGVGADEDVLAINLFLRAFVPKLPRRLDKAIVVDLYGVPFVTPGSLHTSGPLARDAAYERMRQALNTPLPDDTGGPRRLEIGKPADISSSSSGTVSESRREHASPFSLCRS